ncbi:hypothetical protein DFP72DRAFT_990646 [Ephemerocybe angulata]|uniref:F-box domain-containing protein n=1 Tax=Ephemerocybe angulata TaxID=980116 RepID=A0A8H6HUY8_9AGAR|nr:hypothetical protein DFP72DRAFT_990646 [Tulosesus angulatus]
MAWQSLPTEMKLAVVDLLDKDDLESFARVNYRTYQVCVPAKFREVKLASFQALERFLDSVPREYYTHIEELDLSTVDELDALPTVPRLQAEAVISLLAATPRLSKLALKVEGSMDKSIIAPFPYLRHLQDLKISNCGDESEAPLSERLVVSIAASLQNLKVLSLDNISRSGCHADDLICNPDIPVLTLRDTHLGDERWTMTPVTCRLEVLDLGSYVRTDEDFNSMCTQRIMSAVGPSVDEFSLATTVSDHLFAKPTDTPLQRLRKLHISPFFPVDSVVDTVSNLAGSPIEMLSLQCFEEDVVDVCGALEGFLSVRVERGPLFFDKLKRIDITVAANVDAAIQPTLAENEARSFCRDLRLSSAVLDAPAMDAKPPVNTISCTRPTRSMTI